MPIDSKFQKNRKKVGKEKEVTIWSPVDPPEKLGIHGTYVAVDWDLCTGCGVCLKVCPQQLYEWVEIPGHPTSKKKAFPAREPDCAQCYKCETQYPWLGDPRNVIFIFHENGDPSAFSRLIDKLSPHNRSVCVN